MASAAWGAASKILPVNPGARRFIYCDNPDSALLIKEKEYLSGSPAVNAPDPALISSLSTQSAPGLILHFKGGASHGITTLANYAELERRLPHSLLEYNPFICADSVGAHCAAFITAPSETDPKQPRYHSRHYLQIYADHVVNLLSRDSDLAAQTLRAAVGDHKLQETLAALHISAAEITPDDTIPAFFRSYPESFRAAYPDMRLGPERAGEIEVWKAAMASSTSLLHRGSFAIDIDGVTRKFTDIAVLEFHTHLIQHARDFRAAYPGTPLIKIDLGNNYYSDNLPDTRIGKAWVARRGYEQMRRMLHKQLGQLHTQMVDSLVDLSLVVPRGQTIPPAFSNRPEHINRVMEWTQEMVARPEHQDKLDEAAGLILEAHHALIPPLAPALTWPEPIPPHERRIQVAPIVDMGNAFIRSAQPVVKQKTADIVVPLATWLVGRWQKTALPWLRRQWASVDEKLLPPCNRAYSPPAATQPLPSRSSEQHMPSESGRMPL